MTTWCTNNFGFERRLYFAVLQFLPVDVAVENVILDLMFFAGCHTAAESGIRCLRQQLSATSPASNTHALIDKLNTWYSTKRVNWAFENIKLHPVLATLYKKLNSLTLHSSYFSHTAVNVSIFNRLVSPPKHKFLLITIIIYASVLYVIISDLFNALFI